MEVNGTEEGDEDEDGDGDDVDGLGAMEAGALNSKWNEKGTRPWSTALIHSEKTLQMHQKQTQTVNINTPKKKLNKKELC